jgi:antitoxin (DNA-binding transcriptional repressor) of toxin-antitoxin stability system
MDIVDIHEAKTHLSRLIEKAAGGEAFSIAKAGKPIVEVVPLDTNHRTEAYWFPFGSVQSPR